MSMILRHFVKMLPIAFAITGCATASPLSRIPVEVQRVGDDGLTVRFADMLESTFRQSSGFVVSRNSERGTLVVAIPRNLEWTEVRGRVQAIFEVEFRGVDIPPLGSSRGSCWENELEVCAAQVLRDAREVTRSRHP
jgi:hypothetical protein